MTATGSGTGTPVTGGSSTLATLRDRVEEVLVDTTNTRWGTDTIDEALTQALDEITLITPHTAITTLTLSTAGREISIASLDYVNIRRIWWDYDSSDPVHPPNYRDFEVWPGDLLYINDSDEPASGDVVRIWYTAKQTLNGLASESITTLPAQFNTALTVGASGYAALSKAVELTEQLNIDGWTHQRLKEWGELQVTAFKTALISIARQAATKASGIAQTAALDRWDVEGGW